MIHRALGAVITLGFAALVMTPAAAAVRTCSEPLVGDIVVGKSELAAKKAALINWTEKAKVAGYETSLWVTALGRNLTCTKVGKGAYECAAVARACVIKQRAPEGFAVTPRTVKQQDAETTPEPTTTEPAADPVSAPPPKDGT